jgi:hypothetical protein
MLHGTILPDSMRSANNPRINPNHGPKARPVQLQGINGLGVKKLEAYGAQALRVCNGAA